MDETVFCDAKAGELIFSHHIENVIADDFINQIREFSFYRENHVEIIESMEQKLTEIGLERETRIPLRLSRLRIPFGQEIFKINWLFQRYNELCLERLNNWFGSASAGGMSVDELTNITFAIKYPPEIVTNSFYTVASSSNGLFSFTETHEKNLQMINHGRYGLIDPKKQVLIIDSGIAVSNSCNVISRKNFLDNKNVNDVSDETGHGTAIASIINDILPQTELLIYKVVDITKFATEWDLLAALYARNNASVINVSIAYGLEDFNCKKCGRKTEEARSIVFERVINYLYSIGKIVVAAAGNKALQTLSYPARLDHCVAIISSNTGTEISDFSNRSTQDQLQKKHDFVFLAPGGNRDPSEDVFTNFISTKGLGTSFSAAYASAIICGVWSKNESLEVPELLAKLKKDHVNKNFPTYSEETCGNGLLVF
jgi:subtilisin family serine protease